MKNRKLFFTVATVILVVCVVVAVAVSVHQKRETNWNALVDSFDTLPVWTLPVFDKAGSTQKILPTGAVEAGAIVSYQSLDKSIATVDMDGNITAISPGETAITVKTDLNGEIAHHTVKVICDW